MGLRTRSSNQTLTIRAKDPFQGHGNPDQLDNHLSHPAQLDCIRLSHSAQYTDLTLLENQVSCITL